MRINLGYAAAALALTFGGNLVAGEPTKKYIFASWELGDVTPQELLANVDAFDRTGCDGVSWQLRAVLPGASPQHPRHVMEKPVWADKELDPFAPIFTELAKHPSMRHSFFGVNMAPKTSRLRWDDDMVWHVLATNMATLARFAQKVGAVGIIMDFEDYWRKQQYRWVEGDPAYDEALKLARRRGKEVFEGAFDAYPNMTVLSFHLFTDDWEYPRVRDPKSLMRAKRDLFPAFLNGLLDATPPGAKIVDGFERSYSAKASIKTFYRIVRDQNQGIIQLVEPENREKYKVCHSTGFGMFVDAYSDFVKTNSVWYLGPVRGKRTVHLEENLRQATECADEYVWFWGQRGFWIDWPEDLKDPSWRDVFGHSWRKKYVCSKVGRFRPWREILDGDFDMILRGVKDPDGCARAEYERQVAEGSLVALGPSKPMVCKNGRIIIRAGGLVEDGWYGIALKMKGDDDVDALWFRYQGKARWTLGPVRLAFGPKDEEGWRQAFTLLRVPEGTKMISIESIDDVVKRGLSFDGLAVFNIKH